MTTRKRLSREESRDLTAQRLVEAAQSLFARQGLDATSVEDIAEAAGYSRGAFYSNFKTKQELLFEVLRQDQERINAEFAVALDDAMPLEQVQARVTQIYGALYSESDSFMVWTEARMLSARDAAFREKFAALIAERRDFAMALIGYVYKRMGVTPGVSLEAVAMGFISLIEGLRLFGASCPSELPAELARSTLTLFVDAVLQMAGRSGETTNSAAAAPP